MRALITKTEAQELNMIKEHLLTIEELRAEIKVIDAFIEVNALELAARKAKITKRINKRLSN